MPKSTPAPQPVTTLPTLEAVNAAYTLLDAARRKVIEAYTLTRVLALAADPNPQYDYQEVDPDDASLLAAITTRFIDDIGSGIDDAQDALKGHLHKGPGADAP